MKKYNLKKIMSRAWEIYRAADMGDGIRPIFSLCLSMAWDEAKNNGSRIVSEWSEKGQAEQLEMIRANVKKASKSETANYDPDYIRWFMRYHDLDGFVSDAWLLLSDRLDPDYLDGLNERRRAAGKESITLGSLVYRAAKDAVRKALRADRKHGVASSMTAEDKDGDEVDFLDTVANSGADEADSTVLRVALEQFVNGRDDVDRQIIECKRDNMSEREIAAVVGMSCVAVHKRIVKIRAALVADGFVAAN